MDIIDRVEEADRLIEVASATSLPGLGFGWLLDDGSIDASQGVHTWITTRMTHVFSLASLGGDRTTAGLAAAGVQSLLAGPLRDDVHGGWFACVDSSGRPVADQKLAYDHAFVMLAASSALAAGVPDAGRLLDDGLSVFYQRFLDPSGRVIDSYPRDFSAAEAYRGANSSMHSVEALLAVADNGSSEGFTAVIPIIEHLMGQVTEEFGNRLPEHFDADWRPLPEYNSEHREDQFRPYGVTPGHLLEWSRLLLQAEAAFRNPPSWLLPKAQAMFAAAVEIGWSVDGADGFVYTTDWHDRPVVRNRMHWVHAEAVAAAAALAVRTGEDQYLAWGERWWAFIEAVFIEANGNWRHELGSDNQPSADVWVGRPDVYHAYQALRLEDSPLRPSAASALRDQ